MSIFRKKIPCLKNFHCVIRNTLSNPRKNGLPPEVDGEVLQKICRNHFDSPIVKTTYVHLSLWKKQGAYKIFVNMKNGKNFSLFYKFDNFSLENMPALKSFPVPFGNVEHSLYSFPFPPMNVYLPKVYYVRKRDGSLIHQYYLEDLSRDYENIAFGDKNSILFAAKKIKEITCFLTEWKENFKIDDFTIFDGAIKREISKNALRNFKSLQKKRPNTMLETL